MRLLVRLFRSTLNVGRWMLAVSPFLFAFAIPCLMLPAEPVYDNLVDIKTIDPTILVELRYATSRNITGRPLYPPDTPALVRPSTAARLVKAQKFLREHHYGL